MGKKKRKRQETLWVATRDLPASPGHPFYQRLNRILEAHGFDSFVERQCSRFYAPGVGRPSLPPGRYFRLMLLGYFEGLGSERGMAWRAAGRGTPPKLPPVVLFVTRAGSMVSSSPSLASMPGAATT